MQRFDNGLRVVVRANRSAPVVAAQLWVDVGSADEPERLAGISHLLEHMLFKGTDERGVGDVARAIEDAGGEINAWTSFDQTVYHVVMPRRHVARGLGVLADCVSNARMDAKELAKELEVVQEEISEGEDSPATTVAHELFGTAYRTHPYGRPVIGQRKRVQKLTKRQLVDFYRRHYRPERMTLAIVGDIDEADALRAARVAFVDQAGRANALFAPGGDRARSPSAPRRAVEPVQRGLRVVTKSANTREAYLSLAFHIPNLTHEDTPTLDVAGVVLGQGESSRLVRRVKDELHAVTDISAYAYSPRDPGLLVVSATTRPERVIEAFRAIWREVVELTQRRVRSDELARAQAVVDGDWVYQQETMDGLARRLAFYLTVAGDLDFGLEYRRRLHDVTPERLQRLSSRYLRRENMTIAVVTPKADAALAAALREAASKSAPRPAPRPSGRVTRPSAPEVRRTRLRNGARLITMSDPSVPLVAVRAVWLGGVRLERPDSSGINNLLSAVVTRGTRSRTPGEISTEVESMAGSLIGFSGRNSFGLRMDVTSNRFDRALEILADCVCSPAFEQAEIEARRREALDDLHAQEDDPSTIALNLFSAAAYRRHPYGLNPLGSERSVSGLSRRKLVTYYRRHFSVGKMVMSVVGDVDPVEVARQFKELFGGGERGAAPLPGPGRDGRRSGPCVAVRDVDKQQAHVVVGYPGTTVRSRDRHALELIAALLSGQSGRLFLKLRDDLGLAYRLSAFSQEGIEPGFFATYVATSPGKVQPTLQGILEQMECLRERGASARELARAKRYLIGSHEVSLQRRAALASYLAFDELYGLGYLAYQGYPAAVESVTRERLRRVARKYLDENQRVIAVVGPSASVYPSTMT